MNLVELTNVLDWVTEKVQEAGVNQAYNQLRSKLQENVKPDQERVPFEAEKNDLLEALRRVPLHVLTMEQLSFLEKLGFGGFLGDSAATWVEDVLFRNALDAATALGEMQKAANALSQGINRTNTLKKALEGLVEPAEQASEAALIRLSFEGEAEIGNIVDLKKWSAAWHDIGRGLALFHGQPPEDVRVVGAGSGSIVLELAVAWGIAQTVATVILKSLEVAERVQKIRLQAEQIRSLELSNKKLAAEIEKEAEKEKVDGIETIVLEIGENPGAEPVDGERVNALKSSVKGLLDFIEKGGAVDCLVPDEEGIEESDESTARAVRTLRASFESIRLLEERLEQIGPGEKDS